MKNKILIISFFLILLSLLFINNNVFATSSSITEEKRNTIEKVMEEYSDCDTWVSITYRNSEAFFLTSASAEYSLYVKDTTIGVCNGGSVMWYCFWYYPDTNTYKLFYQGVAGDHGEMTISTVYSNNNIYADTSGTEIFFQGAPVTELAPILEKVEMQEPIITTIVGLAVLLIPLLICLIGFWKAWQLLLKILHKS